MLGGTPTSDHIPPPPNHGFDCVSAVYHRIAFPAKGIQACGLSQIPSLVIAARKPFSVKSLLQKRLPRPSRVRTRRTLPIRSSTVRAKTALLTRSPFPRPAHHPPG